MQTCNYAFVALMYLYIKANSRYQDHYGLGKTQIINNFQDFQGMCTIFFYTKMNIAKLYGSYGQIHFFETKIVIKNVHKLIRWLCETLLPENSAPGSRPHPTISVLLPGLWCCGRLKEWAMMMSLQARLSSVVYHCDRLKQMVGGVRDLVRWEGQPFLAKENVSCQYDLGVYC